MPDRQPRVDVLLDDAQVERLDALHLLEEVIAFLDSRRVVHLPTMQALRAAREHLIAQDGAFRALRRHREQFMRRATRLAVWDGSFDRREAERRDLARAA